MMSRKLPEVCEIQYGFPFDSSLFSAEGDLPLIRIRDVVRGYTETYTSEKCDVAYLVHEGDILVGMDGVFNVAKWKGEPAYLNQRVCRIIPNETIDADFLFYFIPTALKKIENETAFVTVKHLKAKQLNAVVVPDVPIEEQKKIAAQLNVITDLIFLRQRQAEKLDELVKARFVEMFGDPVLNCQGFPVRTIGELTTEVKYGTSKPAVEGGKYPYLRMNNLTIDGKLDLHDLKQIDVDTSEFEKCVVRKGDVLFNRTNSAELVGKTAYYGLDEEMIIAGYIIRVRVNNLILPQYLSFYMNMPFMKQRIRSMAKGAVNQANINSKELKSIKVIVPPLEVQGKVVEYEERIDREKDRIQRSAALLETLKRSLMQQYFG